MFLYYYLLTIFNYCFVLFLTDSFISELLFQELVINKLNNIHIIESLY